LYPPPKSAYRLSTDIAARTPRAWLKVAVVRYVLLVVTSNTSTTLEVLFEFWPPPKRIRFPTGAAARA
jgi:hypothetical protein